MNSFIVKIKQNGEWKKIDAISVFPFSWCDLLDERLDEAHLTFYDYPEKAITPLTEFSVEINNNGKVKEKFYILAGDDSVKNSK